jgi:Zn-dependent protease with chaperone function
MLSVVPDDLPDAYGLPGLTGRVVVSTAMLQALPADERRVLLAHEAAHLRHQHHLCAQLAELGAAANQALRPLARAVRDAIERWADEDAAAATGDRSVAARALVRAGLARQQATGPRGGLRAALAAADSPMVYRARALLAPPPPRRRLLAAATAALVIAAVGTAAVTAHDAEHRFEAAHTAYSQPR